MMEEDLIKDWKARHLNYWLKNEGNGDKDDKGKENKDEDEDEGVRMTMMW